MRIWPLLRSGFVLVAVVILVSGCKPNPAGGLTVAEPRSATDTVPANAARSPSTVQSSGAPTGSAANPQETTSSAAAPDSQPGGRTLLSRKMNDLTSEVAASANVPVVQEDASLPGEWKEMLGGFRIKLPPGFHVDTDETTTSGRDTHYTLSGRQPGEVGLNIRIEHLPDEDLGSLAGLVLATQQGKIRQLQPQPADLKVIRLNNLLCIHRHYDHWNPSAFRNRPAVLLHITEFHHSEGNYRVTAGMNSQDAFDHPSYIAGLAYFHTLQRAK